MKLLVLCQSSAEKSWLNMHEWVQYLLCVYPLRYLSTLVLISLQHRYSNNVCTINTTFTLTVFKVVRSKQNIPRPTPHRLHRNVLYCITPVFPSSFGTYSHVHLVQHVQLFSCRYFPKIAVFLLIALKNPYLNVFLAHIDDII